MNPFHIFFRTAELIEPISKLPSRLKLPSFEAKSVKAKEAYLTVRRRSLGLFWPEVGGFRGSFEMGSLGYAQAITETEDRLAL